MEKQKKSGIVKFPAVLWAFIAFALCAAQSSRAGYISASGPIYDPPGDDYYWVTAGATVDLYASGSYWVYIDEGCTVNFQTGSMASEVWAFSGSELNMRGGTISGTINAQADVDLRIYGIYNSMVSEPFPFGEGHWDATINQLVVDDTEENGWNGDLTFTYEGDSATTTLSFSTLSNIIVEADGGGPITVQIDIKPGSDQNNINLKSKGVVPVAILTTDDFDAAMVDPATAEFAGAAPERWSFEDIDGDGDDDIIFHFRTQELELDQDSTEATLTATAQLPTQDDEVEVSEVSGTDQVRIVPPKK